MIYYPQFKEFCERTLRKGGFFKEEAVLAISMVIAHESKGGTFLYQTGNGPALGAIQMEGWVHDDTWKNCDNIQSYASRLGYQAQDVDKLVYDLQYNILMARCRFIMDVAPFPKTAQEMSVYLKNYWNSGLGAATPDKYLEDYNAWLRG